MADTSGLSCSCAVVYVGLKASGARNWNPECPVHDEPVRHNHLAAIHQGVEAANARTLARRLYEALRDDHDGWPNGDPMCEVCDLLAEAKKALYSNEFAARSDTSPGGPQ